VPKRQVNVVSDGNAHVVREQAPSPAEGVALAAEILKECPVGYHPWRVEVQKSDRGRRATVRVWFQKNREANPKR
jgi:hypothetical protein